MKEISNISQYVGNEIRWKSWLIIKDEILSNKWDDLGLEYGDLYRIDNRIYAQTILAI